MESLMYLRLVVKPLKPTKWNTRVKVRDGKTQATYGPDWITGSNYIIRAAWSYASDFLAYHKKIQSKEYPYILVEIRKGEIILHVDGNFHQVPPYGCNHDLTLGGGYEFDAKYPAWGMRSHGPL